MSDTRRERWRLMLGEEANELAELEGEAREVDRVLGSLYGSKPSLAGDSPAGRRGGRGPSQPRAARWLGDIRRYFPRSVVQNHAARRV